MAKLVLNDIVNIDTSVNALNNNFALIEQAIENTVSRDGTLPNHLTGDIDLNSNNLLNCGTVTATDIIVAGSSVATSAANAQTSAVNAALSATQAYISQQAAAISETVAASVAGNLVDLEYRGAWTTVTEYFPNNIVYYTTDGSSYICLIHHQSHATDFTIDLSNGRWGKLADRGAAGAGTGDMLKSENLSGLANYTTARANLGLTIGTHVQEYDATLQALSGALTAANKIPYATALNTLGELDFKDEDTMVSNSATAVPSQQSVKAYIDAFALASATTSVSATGITNISSVGGTNEQHYLRIGNQVHVNCFFSFTTVSTGNTQLYVTVPIASNITALYDAVGFGFSNLGSNRVTVYGSSANTIQVGFTATTTGYQAVHIQYTYTIK